MLNIEVVVWTNFDSLELEFPEFLLSSASAVIPSLKILKPTPAPPLFEEDFPEDDSSLISFIQKSPYLELRKYPTVYFGLHSMGKIPNLLQVKVSRPYSKSLPDDNQIDLL